MATKPIFITASWSTYSKEFQYSIQAWRPSEDSGQILLEEQEVQFETLADIELRRRIASALQGKKAKVLADAYLESKAIDEVIQELLALEDKSQGELT